MVASVVLALALVLLGLIGAVALPGAGWVLLPILFVVAILVVVHAFRGEHKTTPSA
ncbi:MAG: hypothetical protein JWO17_3402 [Actinomycetia bacterium]|jgi:hypothetical protein|nr:hypothetical protein [Actinomycetes bacterium]